MMRHALLHDAVSALASLGHAAWHPLWVPAIAWTALALPVLLVLRSIDTHPWTGYRARHLLLASLPLGLLSSAVLNLAVVPLPSGGGSAQAWDALPVGALPSVHIGGTGLANLRALWSGVGALTLVAATFALASLARLAVDLLRLARMRRKTQHTTTRLAVPDALATMLPRRPMEICVSHRREDVPMALGLATPLVVVPAQVAADVDALRMTLAHEAIHVRRYDDWACIAERVCGALFGWHPLVQHLVRRLPLDREQACDAAVLAEGWATPGPYARLLASVALPSPPQRMALSLSESSSLLLKRLQTMRTEATSSPRPARSSLWLLPLALLLTLGTAACSDSVGPSSAAEDAPSNASAETSAPTMPRAIEGSDITSGLDAFPKLKDGAAALYDQVNYPEEAAQQGVEGKVFVQFVVQNDGTVADATLERGPHPALNQEALRVVRSMTFEPAQKDGKAVAARMTLPLTFKLQDDG